MGVQPIAVPQSLASALNTAGDKSNVDFGYLVTTAQRESSLNPTAKAPSSSATGLFQFLDSTWLQVMKEEGPRLGYQKYADAITQDKNGDYVIKNKAIRAQVLKLRENPQVAADMAAAFTQSNGQYLQQKFGRMPSPGELYIAHFLGPQGAEKLFDAGLQDPDQNAAKLFPSQARSNPAIFYAKGHPRTVREVYKVLVAQHDGLPTTTVPDSDPNFLAQQMANGMPGSRWSSDEVPSRLTKADMSFTQMFSTQPGGDGAQPLIDNSAATPLIDMGIGQNAGPLALLPTETSQSLKAIDTAMSGPPDDGDASAAGDSDDDMTSALGFAPLPAPTPLMPPGAPPLADPLAPVDLPPPVDLDAADPAGAPQPRVLMSPGTHQANSAFFTQVLGQQ